MRLQLVRVIVLAVVGVLALVPLRLCAAPDIALRMTVDTVVPAAGQPVQFTITASNIGTDAASGVQVTDQPPCSVNVAVSSLALDTQTSNNRAVAAVNRATSTRTCTCRTGARMTPATCTST